MDLSTGTYDWFHREFDADPVSRAQADAAMMAAECGDTQRAGVCALTALLINRGWMGWCQSLLSRSLMHLDEGELLALRDAFESETLRA